MTQELHAAFACSTEVAPIRCVAGPSWLAPRPSSKPRSAWSSSAKEGPFVAPPAVRAAESLHAGPIEISEAPGELADGPLPAPPALPAESVRPLVRHEEITAALESVRALGARIQSEVASARRGALEASERDLIRLAVAIASRIVEREVAADASTLARWIASGVDSLTRDDDVYVAASPRVAAILDGVPGVPRIEVEPTLEGDRCEVRTRFGSVEVGARARIETLAAELLGEAP